MSTQQNRLRSLWAKTPPTILDGGAVVSEYHPLILHALDVAAVADRVLWREPETTRDAMASALGLDWQDARLWLLLLAACHDLGKACPAFQGRAPALLVALARDGLIATHQGDPTVNHAFVSQVSVAAFLADPQRGGWQKTLARQAAEALGCHHGLRADKDTLRQLSLLGGPAGNERWLAARRYLFDLLLAVFTPGLPPAKTHLSGQDFMRLSGWISFSDWIGSDTNWFPYGGEDDLADLERWFAERSIAADAALDSLGWRIRKPLLAEDLSFANVFAGLTPRPLQTVVGEAAADMVQPSVVLIEAPMGEGKTEAAWFAHMVLRPKFGHRGLYLALPSRATGNAMFSRVAAFLANPALDPVGHIPIDVQLLHGAASLNREYQDLRLAGVYGDGGNGAVAASAWFNHKKRALLSEYGVGTVDQALLAILPMRHNFVRLWGLANRVVVLDEVHAYDAYTTDLIILLAQWLQALGSTLLLLSATMHPAFRRALAARLGSALPEEGEAVYPRLTVFTPGRAKQYTFAADPELRRVVRLQKAPTSLDGIFGELGRIPECCHALALVNTVDRAQALYCLFPPGKSIVHRGVTVGKQLSDGREIYLFHSRYPADERQAREDYLLSVFGRDGDRGTGRVLVATQVAEQSLDVDFDVMLSDLAPVDLLLQRAGRLWRHKRECRPIGEPVLHVAGLAGDLPEDFGDPLWWGKIYREDILLRTWELLRHRETVTLPDDIDSLVAAVYEGEVRIPDALTERHDQAVGEAMGEMAAHHSLARQAGIREPATFFDELVSGRFFEDEDGTGGKIAPTRLGEESILVIPLAESEWGAAEKEVDFEQARRWSMRAIRITRMKVMARLRKIGQPKSWQRSALLRGAYSFLLDASGRWREDSTVILDGELGLRYEKRD